MKITNSDLQASLSKMMAKGSPLNAIIQEQKPPKQKKTKAKPKSKPKGVARIRQDEETEDKELLSSFTFKHNNNLYEATLRHNTVILLDLETYQSSITHTLWDDEQISNLHHYLQVNWEHLSIHDTEDASNTTFLVDELYDIFPI